MMNTPASAMSRDEKEKFMFVDVTVLIKDAAFRNEGAKIKSNCWAYPQAGVWVVNPEIAKLVKTPG